MLRLMRLALLDDPLIPAVNAGGERRDVHMLWPANKADCISHMVAMIAGRESG